MFDTIKTYLNNDLIRVNNLVDYCEPFLSDITTINSKLYQCTTGTLSSGHKVSINENGISFQGSLTKYYKGTNLIDLLPIEIKYATEKLSDELHLPMELSNITKLDIGLNIETNYSADIYFPSLGNKPRNERHKQSNSIYYTNTTNSFIIYDKIKECKKHRTTLPIEYKTKNVTRAELRLKSISKYFKKNKILLSDLQNKDFQLLSIEGLLREYESINKINIDDMKTKGIKTPDDFLKFCASQYIISQGPETINALTKQLKQDNAFKNKEYYSRLNRKISEITSIKIYQDNSNLIDEISVKLKNKASIYR